MNNRDLFFIWLVSGKYLKIYVYIIYDIKRIMVVNSGMINLIMIIKLMLIVKCDMNCVWAIHCRKICKLFHIIASVAGVQFRYLETSMNISDAHNRLRCQEIICLIWLLVKKNETLLKLQKLICTYNNQMKQSYQKQFNDYFFLMVISFLRRNWHLKRFVH